MTGMSASCKSFFTNILAIATALVAGWLAISPAIAAGPGPFVLCTSAPVERCVVDGDTIEVAGDRIRMLDYDTPEITEPKCGPERALGLKATLRLLELLNAGDVQLQAKGDRDTDKYGRKLRLVLVDGRSVGDTLVAEGLAWPWEGHRHAWCGQ